MKFCEICDFVSFVSFVKIFELSPVHLYILSFTACHTSTDVKSVIKEHYLRVLHASRQISVAERAGTMLIIFIEHSCSLKAE